ncbi:hypothetical protein KYY02_29905 [Streptomyces pimonensis]|uniref:Uncharacterized protein n=1 Tax=Streptomyces pimonensis TaxID=2860288 RepID=A0ABV4J709_9ACTN
MPAARAAEGADLNCAYDDAVERPAAWGAVHNGGSLPCAHSLTVKFTTGIGDAAVPTTRSVVMS